jgi:uncharacterized protein
MDDLDADGAAVAARVDALDWPSIHASLWARGFARAPALLDPAECGALADAYGRDGLFRSRVVMARHQFGEGEYKYFAGPLPGLVRELRRATYRHLAPIANAWSEALDGSAPFPERHEEFLSSCHAQGQTRPTPLLLRYTEGGFNCLHQDLYGPVHFPLQIVIALDRPDLDYEGGHFLLVEGRPRAQSRGEALRPGQGEAIVFTTRTRPAQGARGFRRVNVRHGLSTVTRGRRHALGLVYHDAE